MAEVYLAEDERLQRKVAVKILPMETAGQTTLQARFEREARAAARLQHPHILAVYDYGQQDGVTYLVMPYMNGGSLAQIIARARGPLPMEKIVQWTGEMGSALKYAHDQGIIHRDVKPGNMLVGPGEHLLLSDFGIAKVMDATTALTNIGSSVGSPEYMAPEQASGDAEYRSDIYALGVVIFQMLTGRVPFSASTPMQVMVQQVQQAPPSPRALNPAVSPQVETVVLRALAKRPQQRYQSATELAEALKAAAAGQPAPQSIQAPAVDLSTRLAAPGAAPAVPPRGTVPVEARKAAQGVNIAPPAPAGAASAGAPGAYPSTRSRPRPPAAGGQAAPYQPPASSPASYAQQPAPTAWQQSGPPAIPAPSSSDAPAAPTRKRGTRLLLVLLILLLLVAVGLGVLIFYVVNHPGAIKLGALLPLLIWRQARSL